MADTKLQGRWGEDLAAAYLKKKKYQLVACNYSCGFGEIDLIVQNRQYLVFVEVKLRKSADYGQAMEFVDSRKQARIRTTAEFWLSQHETGLQPRFDVVEVYAPQGMDTKHPVIHHVEDAFE